MRANPALNLVQLAAGIALLLRQLVKRVGDVPGAILLLLSFTAGFQQLAADLENLLVQRIRGEGSRDLARLIAQIIELCAQGLRQFREVIDNVLVLTDALKGSITLLKGVEGRLQDFDGLRLGGLRRLRLFQFLSYLFSIRGCRCVRPKTEAPGQQESVYQAHGVTFFFQELTFVLFIVNQRTGGMFSADFFLCQRSGLDRRYGFRRGCQRLAYFGGRQAV